MANTITFNMVGKNGAGRSGSLLIDDPLIIVPCGSGAYPFGALAVDVTSTPVCDITFDQSAGASAYLGDAHAAFVWTSQASGGQGDTWDATGRGRCLPPRIDDAEHEGTRKGERVCALLRDHPPRLRHVQHGQPDVIQPQHHVGRHLGGIEP